MPHRCHTGESCYSSDVCRNEFIPTAPRPGQFGMLESGNLNQRTPTYSHPPTMTEIRAYALLGSTRGGILNELSIENLELSVATSRHGLKAVLRALPFRRFSSARGEETDWLQGSTVALPGFLASARLEVDKWVRMGSGAGPVSHARLGPS
jgi:hypothetical protein